MFDPFGALINGLIGLDRLHKDQQWIDFGVSLVVNWFVVLTFTWGTSGIGMYTETKDAFASLTMGFLTGLVTSAVFIYTRVKSDPRCKKWTFLVPMILEQKAQEASDSSVLTTGKK